MTDCDKCIHRRFCIGIYQYLFCLDYEVEEWQY